MKVEVDVLDVPDSPGGLCGCKATVWKKNTARYVRLQIAITRHTESAGNVPAPFPTM